MQGHSQFHGSASLLAAGLTSGEAVRLTTLIEERLRGYEGITASPHRLPATLVFDYPSMAAIVEFLESEGFGRGGGNGGGGAPQGTAGTAPAWGGTRSTAIPFPVQPPALRTRTAESRAWVLQRVRSVVCSVSGASSLDDDDPLLSSGLLNSAGAVRLTPELEAVFGVAGGAGAIPSRERRLPPTLAFDHPSVTAIVDYLMEEGYANRVMNSRTPGETESRAEPPLVRQMQNLPLSSLPFVPDARLRQPSGLAITAACHTMPGKGDLQIGSFSQSVTGFHRPALDATSVPPLAR